MADPMKRRIHLIDRKTHQPSPDGEPAFWCPVCDSMHIAPRSMWAWNGDFDRPTLGPVTPGAKFSYVVSHEQRAHSYWILARPGKDGTIKFDDRESALRAAPSADWQPKEVHVPARRYVHCHTYIRDGSIQVLPDSERLKGQTVPLPEWELR